MSKNAKLQLVTFQSQLLHLNKTTATKHISQLTFHTVECRSIQNLVIWPMPAMSEVFKFNFSFYFSASVNAVAKLNFQSSTENWNNTAHTIPRYSDWSLCLYTDRVDWLRARLYNISALATWWNNCCRCAQWMTHTAECYAWPDTLCCPTA